MSRHRDYGPHPDLADNPDMMRLTHWLGRFSGRTGADPAGPRTLLIGTATTVRQMAQTLREADEPLDVVGCCLLQPRHRAGAIGVPVLGTCEQLEWVQRLHRPTLALLSLPAAMHAASRKIAARLSDLGVTVRLMPTLTDQLRGFLQPGTRPVEPAALLNRQPHRLDEAAIQRLLKNRRVMITGAGGSIGGELARIVARFQPAELQLMERAENNLFEIQRDLNHHHPALPTRALLHDVTDAGRTLALCEKHRPQIIFHAAAHKHVPMMEDHPRQAVVNNVLGTRAIADAADAVGVERFVMISTDKAVNPTSVMGATKRLAELYIQDLNQRSGTDYAMVRFGNVLGSACSVVPIWADQLSRGGPITVTDPRMTRYFMTISEAAALVIQAATLPEVGGHVLLLDMGEPIRIVDLARRFLRLQGLEPDRDVDIVFTGIRPGEKLFEELACDGEAMMPTAHEAVHLWRTRPPEPAALREALARLAALEADGDGPAVLAALRRAVPEMQSHPGRTGPEVLTGAAPMRLQNAPGADAAPTDQPVLAG